MSHLLERQACEVLPSILRPSSVSAMEIVAAFSLVCNVLQLAETSRKVFVTVKELRLSIDGSTHEINELRLTAQQLRQTAENIMQKEDDERLCELAQYARNVTDEHVASLEAIRLKDRGSLFQATLAAVKARYRKKDLEDSQARIDRLARDITNHIIATRVPAMDSNIDGLVQRQFASDQMTSQNFDAMKRQLERVNSLSVKGVTMIDTTNESITRLQHWITKNEQLQSRRQCMHALYFPQLRSREDAVREAHKKTFGWIFEDRANDITRHHEPRFRNWLQLERTGQECFLGFRQAWRWKEYPDEVSSPPSTAEGASATMGWNTIFAGYRLLLLEIRINRIAKVIEWVTPVAPISSV